MTNALVGWRGQSRRVIGQGMERAVRTEAMVASAAARKLSRKVASKSWGATGLVKQQQEMTLG